MNFCRSIISFVILRVWNSTVELHLAPISNQLQRNSTHENENLHSVNTTIQQSDFQDRRKYSRMNVSRETRAHPIDCALVLGAVLGNLENQTLLELMQHLASCKCWAVRLGQPTPASFSGTPFPWLINF